MATSYKQLFTADQHKMDFENKNFRRHSNKLIKQVREISLGSLLSNKVQQELNEASSNISKEDKKNTFFMSETTDSRRSSTESNEERKLKVSLIKILFFILIYRFSLEYFKSYK